MPAIKIGTFESIANWRSAAAGTTFDEVRLGAENQLTGALHHLFAMADEHPELRASEEFQLLAQNIESVEESLRNARSRYNATVRDYNERIARFPGNLLARVLGLKPKPFFGLPASEEKLRAASKLPISSSPQTN
ncbi:MAG: LemA family protein [Bryobacteraceae bacterium]